MSRASVAERAASLVEELFAAPHDPASWQRFLASLGAALGDDCVVLLLGELLPGGPHIAFGHGIDMSGVRSRDVRPAGTHPPPEALPLGRAIPIQASDLTFARSRLFRDVLAKRGLRPGPGAYLPLFRNPTHITGALFVVSTGGEWLLTPERRALLELLAPYISSAARAGMRLYVQRMRASALLSAVGRLQLGVVLLDVDGRVTFANESALDTLGLADLPDSSRDRYRRATTALAPLLRTGAEGAAMWTHPHPEDGRLLQLHRAPLRDGSGLGEQVRYATAIFVSDPAAPVPSARGSLRALYGLSPSEARLAEHLAEGHTLAEAAEQLGIRLSTARSTLRGLFQKTGTHRQTSLVRLILSGPGRVREAPAGQRRRRSVSH